MVITESIAVLAESIGAVVDLTIDPAACVPLAETSA
jgi:hypothetical protein